MHLATGNDLAGTMGDIIDARAGSHKLGDDEGTARRETVDRESTDPQSVGRLDGFPQR
jgi:hypothetical protein